MATNITQQYDRNVEFNTYTHAELLSDVWGELSTQWKWEGRTLSCLQLSDGTQINPGDPLTLDADYTAISGIWTMNMSPDPVKIYFIGDSGEVSVTVTEYNGMCPLGKWNDRFVRSNTYCNIDEQGNKLDEVSAYVYVQPDQYSSGQQSTGSESESTYVKIALDVKSGVVIKRISWGNEDSATPTQRNFWSGTSPKRDFFDLRGGPWDFSHGFVSEQKQYGLSVFFTTQGTLTYYPNKD